ncbi:MAG: NUDIX hydrolase [Candidatus Cyclonatronum sp.]|uniref:NUDIX domain-containing protein n=1 Tax=Cyclonatronum sp. TaxID=3024185 RepID=UPI0025C3457B|nr:NUDIX hydrolase [Cyclonatronum sp.]MCH8485235.1 NUDIX hydrolase [Cyclonatronum sp.]
MDSVENWAGKSAWLKEKRHSGKQVYKGVLLNAWQDDVILPDGSRSKREYIKHPGASVVLPVFENGDVMLIGQYRYPVQQALLEVPAGKLDAGEPPEVTARRELTEETGLSCRELHYIGFFHPCIGYSDEVIHLFTAWDLAEGRENTDDDEFLTHFRLPFAKAVEMVHSGEITDSKTIISLLRTKAWWDRSGPFPLPGQTPIKPE